MIRQQCSDAFSKFMPPTNNSDWPYCSACSFQEFCLAPYATQSRATGHDFVLPDILEEASWILIPQIQ